MNSVLQKDPSKIIWVFVGGAIGAGKSTLCRMLQHRLETTHTAHVVFLEEYVETQEGLEMLQRFLTASIDQYAFQKHILDFYASHLATICAATRASQDQGPIVILVERHPMDSILIFSQRSLQRNEISREQYDALFRSCQDLPWIPQFMPSAHNCRLYSLARRTDYSSLEDDVFALLLRTIPSRKPRTREKVLYLILLFSDNPESRALQRENVVMRMRKGEDTYSAEYLEWINSQYWRVYSNVSGVLHLN